MKEIQNIIEQVEQGVITAQESVKLIKAIVIEFQEDELLDYAFACLGGNRYKISQKK